MPTLPLVDEFECLLTAQDGFTCGMSLRHDLKRVANTGFLLF